VAQPRDAANIQADLGDVSGQVAVGDYNVQINADHGAVVNFAAPEKRPRLTLRPSPILLRPRAFLGLLDRDTEVSSTISSFGTRAPVEFCGEAGLGKTTLLRYLAYHPGAAALPDGIVFLRVGRLPVTDLVQSLFDAFYESDLPFKPTDAQVRHLLHDRRALILLDDMELARDDVGAVLDTAPGCTFVMATAEPRLWGEGRALALQGLPVEDALLLVERETGRPLTPSEDAAARLLCAALQGHPLRILQALAIAQREGRSLAELAPQVQAAAAPAALNGWVLSSLSASERQVLAALGAVGGTAVHVEHAAALTQLPDAKSILDGLSEQGLVEVLESRCSLAGDLAKALQEIWGPSLEQWTRRALVHFTTWAEQRQKTPDVLLQEAEVMLWLLEWAVGAGLWVEANRLGRVLEAALTLRGRWGAWERVLLQLLQATRAFGDKAGEARALHQLGTRDLCLGGVSTAKTYLSAALGMRQELGDQMGAAVTRHNLNLVVGAPPPNARKRPRNQANNGTGPNPRVPRLLKFGLVSAPIAALAVAVAVYLAPRPPVPPPAVEPTSIAFAAQEVGVQSAAQSLAVTNTTAAPLKIGDITLVGAAADDFKIVDNACSRAKIAPGGSCAISLVFAPSALGTRNASLIINNDAGAALRKVDLAGNGIRLPKPEISVTPDQLVFANQEVGIESAPQEVTLRNPGSAPVNISSVSLIGANASNFKAVAGCDKSDIAPDGTCTIKITFTPGGRGDYVASLVIAGNAVSGPRRVSLRGAGVVSTRPAVSLSSNTLDFGNQEVGGASAAQRIVLTNSGPVPLNLSRIGLTGANAADFEEKNNCGRSLNPAGACVIEIAFSPKGEGRRNASLTITDDAANGQQSALLNGTGVKRNDKPGQLTISPNPFDLNGCRPGAGCERTFTLANNTGASVAIGVITLIGLPADEYRIGPGCAGRTIPQGGRCAFKVTFALKQIAARDVKVQAEYLSLPR